MSNVVIAEGELPQEASGYWPAKRYVVETVPMFGHTAVTVIDPDEGADEWGDTIEHVMTATEVYALAGRLRELGVEA